MKSLDFSPSADDEWSHFLSYDRKVAEIADPLFDEIETGGLPGQMYANHARFTTFRVPGRDDIFAIVWEVRDEYLYVLRIGRI